VDRVFHNVDLEELRDRIPWLVRLRWAAILGVLITIWIASQFLRVRLDVVPLLIIVGALAAYNLTCWAVGRWVPAATAGVRISYFANLQIALDLVALTSLFHFAGGVDNPFLCYYVFHIVIASILLSRAATYVQVTLAMALLVTMASLEATGKIPHYHLIGFIPTDLYRSPVYILGVLFAIATMLYFTAFMATSITRRLRRREAEIVRLSDALREHADDLGQAYEALRHLEGVRSDYLHRVAHHIRSPLATLERMLAVVEEGRTGQIPERSVEMLERARGRIGELLALARDLLVLSRTREAPPLAQRERVDLVTVVQNVARDLRHEAAAASISLQADCPDSPVEIIGDPDALQELVENLVSNAVKYTNAGGDVRIAVTVQSGLAELAVSDTGIGIPEAEQEHIFEEFYRAANARDTGKLGTGLGLSIVKAVSEVLGGNISVTSALGRGTCFRVSLPRSGWTGRRSAEAG
jgi:signal transduction histidine kinase